MKYYIIAGEASGDLYGANLIQSIKKIDSQAQIRCLGGDHMLSIMGKGMAKHYKDMAFMGFWEVLFHLKSIFKNISFCKNDILSFSPDIIIYIDYPGFNLRIAKWAKKKGFLNHYYISPKVWAWKESRIKYIKRDIDKMYLIFPFEKKLYTEKYNMDCAEYVGNPLLETIPKIKETNFHTNYNLNPQKKIIALLPGSRKQEIRRMLPVFLETSKLFPKYQFVIAASLGIDPTFYDEFTENYSEVKIIRNQTYSILQNAHAAIVTSGTATLETALLKVPQIICYKTSNISYQIIKRLIKISYISLVNIIANKEVILELIQKKCNVKEIETQLRNLFVEENRNKIMSDYETIEKLLKVKGSTSNKIAQSVFSEVNKLKS